MDVQIALMLAQDGLTNGAIYALLALALVLVFAVTRVIFIPQGEFVAYGALTLAMLQTGKIPGTVWLLLIMAALAAVVPGAGSAPRTTTQLIDGLDAIVELPVFSGKYFGNQASHFAFNWRDATVAGPPNTAEPTEIGGWYGPTGGPPATRRAPLKRVCQYASRMSSTRTCAPERGAWMNLPSPTFQYRRRG